MTFLAQHIKGELQVPGADGIAPVTVNVLMDIGTGVASILEELLMEMQRLSTGMELAIPFKGDARVRKAFDGERIGKQQTIRLLLTLLTHREDMRFQVPFVILPEGGDLIF